MPVTPEELLGAIVQPIEESLGNEGITLEYLAKKLKKELNAKEVKAFYDRKTKEVVYSKKLPAWEVRQRARIDAHKLLGHYPAEKHELTARMGVTDYNELEEETKQKLKKAANKIVQDILKDVQGSDGSTS